MFKNKNTYYPLYLTIRLILIGLLVLNYSAQAQQEAYIESTISKVEIPVETWENITEGFEFPEPQKTEEEKEEEEDQEEDFKTNDFDFEYGTIFKIIAFIIVAGIITFFIIQVTGGKSLKKKSKKNEKLVSAVDIELEEVEDRIHETDLRKLLDICIAEGAYDKAIRLYYLEILKQLSLKELIDWKKEKTNYAYLRDLKESMLHDAFKNITRIFEECQYGKVAIDASRFKSTRIDFEAMLSQIENLPYEK